MTKTITLDIEDWETVVDALLEDEQFNSESKRVRTFLEAALKEAPTVVQVETLTAIGDGPGELHTGTISTFKPFDIDGYASGIEKRAL